MFSLVLKFLNYFHLLYEKMVLTQGIATTVAWNNEKYSNILLHIKMYVEKWIYKGFELPYIVNDVYLSEYDNEYFFDL